MPPRAISANPERAALVSLLTGPSARVDPELALEELSGLAAAAGAIVVLRAVRVDGAWLHPRRGGLSRSDLCPQGFT